MGANTTILVGVAIFVLSVFVSAWLNLRQIEWMIDSMKGELRAEIGGLRAEIRAIGKK